MSGREEVCWDVTKVKKRHETRFDSDRDLDPDVYEREWGKKRESLNRKTTC